jgi:type I restriction enzyme S subunit
MVQTIKTMSTATTHIETENNKPVLSDSRRVPAIRFKEFDGEWEKHTLKRLLGALVDCEHKTAPYVDDSEYLVVRTNNVKSGQLLYKDIKYTTEEGFKEWTKRTVPKFGDILFTREAPAGESCLVPENKKVCLGQRMVLLKSDDSKMTGQYLSSYLQSGSAIRDISNLSIGTTVTRINIADIYNLKCPVSTLPEQQKIASFLSAVDEKIQQLTKKKALLEDYKKGVMQRLFCPNHDSLDLHDEQDYKSEKNQENLINPKKSRLRPLRFKDENGNPYPDWEEKKFGDLYSFYTTNSLSRDKLNYETGTVYNIHYGDIHTKFKTAFNLMEEFIPFINDEVDLSKIKPQSYCKSGDLVMADASEDYADIGKTIELMDLKSEKVLAGLHTFLARPITTETAIGFFSFLLKSWSMRKQIMVIAQGSKVLSLSTGRVGKLKLRLPVIEEQKKIATYLSGIDTKIERVNTQITQNQTFKKGLLQQMFV